MYPYTCTGVVHCTVLWVLLTFMFTTLYCTVLYCTVVFVKINAIQLQLGTDRALSACFYRHNTILLCWQPTNQIFCY